MPNTVYMSPYQAGHIRGLDSSPRRLIPTNDLFGGPTTHVGLVSLEWIVGDTIA
jgi:hypothetical protein